MHELKLQITHCPASLGMDALHAPASVMQVEVWYATLILALCSLRRQVVL